MVAAGKQFAETSAEGRGSSSLELHLLNAQMSPRKTEACASLHMQGGDMRTSRRRDSHSRRARNQTARVKCSGGHQVGVSHVLSMAGLCSLTRNGALVPLPRTPRMAVLTHAPVSIRQCQLTQAN